MLKCKTRCKYPNARHVVLSHPGGVTSVYLVQISTFVGRVTGQTSSSFHLMIPANMMNANSHSQVHELHPSHAFLTVPDRPVRTSSEPDFLSPVQPDSNEEQCKPLLVCWTYTSQYVQLASSEASRCQMCSVSRNVALDICAF